MNVSSFAALLCLAALLAPGTALSQQDPSVVQYNSANASVIACVQNLNSNPAYAPLLPYGMLHSWNEYTVDQLADTSYISDNDIQLVKNYQSARLQCMTQFENDLAPVDTRLSDGVERERQLFEQNDLLLIRRKETWGQFSINRENIASAYQAAMDSVIQEKNAEVEQANNISAQQRQQALANFMTFIQNQELIDAAKNPIYCTSNNFGGTIQTVCR